MDLNQTMPAITVMPGGGYSVSFVGHPEIAGTGATVDAALQALSVELRSRLHSEKGDESEEAQTAAKQADILANDRFIRGNNLQHSVMLAAALGLI